MLATGAAPPYRAPCNRCVNPTRRRELAQPLWTPRLRRSSLLTISALEVNRADVRRGLLAPARIDSASSKIRSAATSESRRASPRTKSATVPAPSPPHLGWTHYLLLMLVANPTARAFYELETARESWSNREVERQIASHNDPGSHGTALRVRPERMASRGNRRRGARLSSRSRSPQPMPIARIAARVGES